jgi:hypothetical protein
MRTGRTNVRRVSPLFATWLAIQSRGPICKRWCAFPIFYFDVGPRPSWRHLLIRDDPTGEFGPGNAGWRIAARYRWRRPTAQGAGAATPPSR